jgi:hypothetical protein
MKLLYSYLRIGSLRAIQVVLLYTVEAGQWAFAKDFFILCKVQGKVQLAGQAFAVCIVVQSMMCCRYRLGKEPTAHTGDIYVRQFFNTHTHMLI